MRTRANAGRMDVIKTPPGISIQMLLDCPLRRSPNKVALIDERASLTFAEIDTQAASLARAFARAGSSPGDRIAVILPNSIPFIVTEMAILRGGMVKVPLNSRFHVNEVMYSLVDSEPKILVCD